MIQRLRPFEINLILWLKNFTEEWIGRKFQTLYERIQSMIIGAGLQAKLKFGLNVCIC
jgi:hypothetical protein